jgi:predicted ester cyclase
MNVEEKRVVAKHIVEEFLNKNNPAVAKELFADDFVNHSPQYGVSQDRDGLIQTNALSHRGFPDIKFILEDLIVENDKIVLHMRCTGKHTGEYIGIQPTNKSIDTRLISILRIENGKVKERWNVTNPMETLQQLGLM